MSEARLISDQHHGNARTFEVSLDEGPISMRVDSELRRMAKSIRLPGYRPGKVPLKILRQRLGAEIRNAVVDRMAIGVARRLIDEHDLQPIGRPRIDIREETGDAVIFALQLENRQAIDVSDVGGFDLVHLRPDPADPSLAAAADQDLRRQLFDALLGRYAVELPEEMTAHELKRITRGFEAEVGTPPDPETRRQLEEIAARRCRLAVLLTEIGNVHDIRVSRTEIDGLIEQEAATDPEHRGEIIDYYLDHPTALAELQSPVFEERVVSFLLSRCDVTERTVPAAELRGKLNAT